VPEGFIFEQLCNHRHRLTGMVDPNNGNAPSALYEYDALNRRIHKKTWDNSGDVAMDVKTLNDGWQPVQELNNSLIPTANLLTAPWLDEIFRRTTTAANSSNPSTTNDYLTDALHTTLALTDTSGTIKTKYSYEPYGATSVYTIGTTTPSDNTYQYTGRENDGNGLYYYRNRFLLPGVGAFLSEDPMGFAAGQNLNGCVSANPISRRDPKGLDWGIPSIPTGVGIPSSGYGTQGQLTHYQSPFTCEQKCWASFFGGFGKILAEAAATFGGGEEIIVWVDESFGVGAGTGVGAADAVNTQYDVGENTWNLGECLQKCHDCEKPKK
jgi:RHS repeat-associated protein